MLFRFRQSVKVQSLEALILKSMGTCLTKLKMSKTEGKTRDSGKVAWFLLTKNMLGGIYKMGFLRQLVLVQLVQNVKQSE